MTARSRRQLLVGRSSAQAAFAVSFLFLTGFVSQGPPPARENAIRFVHDPCIIREGEWYYVFSTGHGIPIRRSRDLALRLA